MIEFEKALHQEHQKPHTFKSLTGGRIYPVRLPQSPAFPCVRYQIVSATDQATHSGADGQKSRRVQYSIFAKSYSDIVAVDRALIDLMQARAGSFGTDSAIHSVLYEGSFDQWEDDQKIYHRATDFIFRFNT